MQVDVDIPRNQKCKIWMFREAPIRYGINFLISKRDFSVKFMVYYALKPAQCAEAWTKLICILDI